MKALPFKIPKPSNTAIIFQVDKGSFYGQLHQHEELQISLIQKGRGTLVVADAIHHYQEGDLLILGGNQPHVFRNENTQGIMHTVFYSPLSFGKTFLDLEEGKGVGDFYSFAKAGFKIKASPDIYALFEYLTKAKGIHRLSYFLQLIAILKVAKRETLSSFVYGKKISEIDGQKMNAIFDYSLEHFSEPIYLAEVAKVAAMSPNAFCKYFKKRTNKTYFQFLTEVRLEHACKLLRNNHELSVVHISEAAGFQTLSHFNRKFRQYKMCAPSTYRKTTV
jgi:AraC-like DNA-binding protein/quercetin dioxygenase-like cupin family protein